MTKTIIRGLLATALLFGAPLAAAPTPSPVIEAKEADAVTTDFIKIDHDITLRHMVINSAKPQGTVLLLHGFPETLHVWDDIAAELGRDYKVHAFDWPGYGQSSRPPADRFSYAPADYAKVLKGYIEKAGIDRSTLTIYATDIGALPALLAAIDQPDLARTIIVGDFAPFNRPQYMHERIQRLKSEPSASLARAELNANSADVLANAFTRGLPVEKQFAVSKALQDDMAKGWDQGGMTSADAFFHYYAHFTRDEDIFEANIGRLRTPVTVVWGAEDFYIKPAMGAELAEKLGTELKLLPGVGHYAHLQAPEQAIAEIRASFAQEEVQ